MNRSLNGRGNNPLPAAALIALGLLVLPASAGAQKPAAPATDAYLRELIPPAPAIHQSLKGDERLSKPVTIAMGDVPIADLLAELSKASGIGLSASDDVADDMVIAGFKDRPLGSVLTLLSTHFGFTWRRKGRGYELWRDLASKNREEALRNEQTLGLVRYVLALGSKAEAPLDAILAQRTQLVEALRNPELSAGEREVTRNNLRDLQALSGADMNLGLRLLARTPAERITQFLKSGELLFSTARGEIPPGEISRWQSERLAQSRRTGSTPSPDEGAPLNWLQVHYSLLTWKHAIPNAPSVEVVVRYEAGDSPGVAGSSILTPKKSPAELPGAKDERLLIPIPVIKRSFEYPGAFKAGPYLSPWQYDLRLCPADQPSVADVFLGLHRATGLDLLSDSFTPWRSPYPLAKALTTASVQTLLQEISARHQLGMSINDGVLRVRHAAYFTQRPGTVPTSAIRNSVKELKPDARAYLQTITALAGSLNEAQRTTLMNRWGYFWSKDRYYAPIPRSSGVRRDIELPALLSRLSPDLRAQLLAGAVVAVEGLSRMDMAVLNAQVERRIREARITGAGPQSRSRAPVALVLASRDQLLEAFATYGPDGRMRSIRRSSVRPGHANSPGSPIGGLTPVLVGSAYPETEFTLQMFDAQGGLVETLGTIRLIPPCPYLAIESKTPPSAPETSK